MLTLLHDPSPADWITKSPLPWQDLVAFGPDCFEAYARLRFIPDPSSPDAAESDVDTGGPVDFVGQLRELGLLLQQHSGASPEAVYHCLWEGWPLGQEIGSEHESQVVIPGRRYFLFTGSLEETGLWDDSSADRGGTPAAFIWPASRSWCIAFDVDSHWAGVGASSPTIAGILTSSELDVVPADRSQVQPAYLKA